MLSHTRKGYLVALFIVAGALLIAFPALRAGALALPVVVAALLYNLFALLIIASFAALLTWYLFAVVLRGILRQRKLRQLRYRREIEQQRRRDREEDDHH